MAAMLFRGARLIDPQTATETPGDLLVEGRQVAAVGAALTPPENCEIIDCAGLILAPGLVDAGVFRADVAAATAGGITSIILMPDQAPPLDDPALVERAQRLGKPQLWVRPLAAATQGLNGRDLAELGLMQEAGAVAVATGRMAIADSRVMLRLLRYAAGLGLVVVTHAECPFLTAGTVATEGEPATRLGLAAAPACAEAVQIGRDVRLAREAGCALHIACVTTAEGIALVRRAQAVGQDVTAATTPDYALLSESAIADYRSFARLSPPLRSESDRQAVRAALADGTISVLTSRHDPRTPEEKRLPFADAAPGAAGAATLLALGLQLVREDVLSLPQLMSRLSWAPAQRFGLAAGRLQPGAPADILLLDPATPWRIDSAELAGLAGNTPFDGTEVWGSLRMVLKGGEKLH